MKSYDIKGKLEKEKKQKQIKITTLRNGKYRPQKANGYATHYIMHTTRKNY